MGRIHRLQGKTTLLYYLPRRFRPLWDEVRAKGYTLRDIVIVGLLLAYRSPGWAKIKVRISRPSPRSYSIRVPHVVIRLLKEEERDAPEKPIGEAGAEGSQGAASED